MRRSRSHVIRPTPGEWDGIRARARAAGMGVSPFLIACALHEAGPGEAAGEGALALSEAEQRLLSEQAGRLDLCARALLGPVPGLDVGVWEALGLLARLAAGSGPAAGAAPSGGGSAPSGPQGRLDL